MTKPHARDGGQLLRLMDAVAGVTTGERRDQKGDILPTCQQPQVPVPKDHLLKTFWTGIDGWADHQLPDGTVMWTAPTGHTYKTLPGSRIFFPAWDTTTAALPRPSTPAPRANSRGVMMPTRARNRAAERARRSREERKLNDAYVAERNKPPPF